MSNQPSRTPAPRSLLGSFLQFLRSPDLNAPSSKALAVQKFIHFLRLYGLEVAIISILWLTSVTASIPEKQLLGSATDTSAASLFIQSVIEAPLIEETIFRLPLRPFVINIVLSCSVLIGSFALFTEHHNIVSILIILVAANLIIKIKYPNERVLQPFYTRYPHVIFYGIALLFGALHVINYESTPSLLPLSVLPQTIGGIFLGFIRIRYGFWWAIAFHALHNGCIQLPIFITDTFGSKQLLEASTLPIGTVTALPGSDLVLIGTIRALSVALVVAGFVTMAQMIKEWWNLDRKPR